MVLNKYEDIAKKAVDLYGFRSYDLTFEVEETNVIYKVTTEKGDYALKIFEEASSCLEDNQAEAYFLSMLENKLDIRFPKLVRNKEGNPVTCVYCHQEKKMKRSMLYEWMTGQDHYKHESMESFEELGQLIGKLHNATRHGLLTDLSPKKWDKVFFYKDEIPVYHKEVYKRYVKKEVRDCLDKLIPHLNEVLRNIYQEYDMYLIHGDLNPWNIKLSNEGLYLIDYEEAMLGCPLHDIATFLYYYTYHDKWSYLEVKQAFLKGYHTTASFEFDDYIVDSLVIARRVNFMNYVLTIRKDPSTFINESAIIIKDYMDKVGLGYE